MQRKTGSDIDPRSAAESILSLLGRLNVANFPWAERLAVGAWQAKSLKACHAGEEKPPSLKARRLHWAVLRALSESRRPAR